MHPQHKHTYTHMHTEGHTRTHMQKYTHTHTHTHMYMDIYAHIFQFLCCILADFKLITSKKVYMILELENVVDTDTCMHIRAQTNSNFSIQILF